ncbi:hypothetical protein [Micromonospora echinofusca]|uniref:Protein ImuA n=1 Tax=Micromonospora echinofusca TaxID=47858 RepID=A0ABS3VTQ2_MICEH|nr:hypothetical protein [Micromonospora echinofusca]MBO4207917.1 hypothetical protein [Micromonospora echinofusca]
MADLARLRALLGDTDPRESVGDQLPMIPPIRRLLGSRVRRGALVAIEGEAARYSLSMVLLAGVSSAGGWCAVVGVPAFGCVAAAAYGVRPETLGLVPQPGAAWTDVLSALTTGMDAVLVHRPEAVPGGLARQLTAKARRSGCTVLTLGPAWEGSDLRISVVRRQWYGLAQGGGRLRRCRVTVVASHRPRVRVDLWLPAEDGGVREAAPVVSAA